MWSLERIHRLHGMPLLRVLLVAASLAAWVAGLLACHVEPEEERFLDVRADTTWLAFDSVSVLLADSAGKTLEVLRRGPLDSLEQLDRLEARKFSGGKTVLVLVAYRDGLAVRRETRKYDGGTQTTEERKVETDIHVLNPGQAPRLDLGPDTLRLYRGGVPAVLRPAPAATWEGKPMDWSTNDAGIATVSRGVVTPVGAGTTRILAKSGSAADSITVIVAADVPKLFAGEDTIVQAPATLAFRVRVTQEHGGIALFKWSLDGDTAWDDSLRGFPDNQATLLTDVRRFTVPGQFVLRFLVEDGEGNQAVALRFLTVVPDRIPLAPSADAGRDTTVLAGTLVTLVGSATDPDGTIVSREWQYVGNAIPLANTDTYVFVAKEIGVHRFLYRVFDSDGLAVSDTVQVTVLPLPVTRPPEILAILVESSITPDGSSIAFTALVRSYGAMVTCSWDYNGDGRMDEMTLMPSRGNDEVDTLRGFFNYNARGEYWVELRVLDSGGGVATGGTWVIIDSGTNGTGLSDLNIDLGPLFPKFSPTIHEYWYGVSSTVTSIHFSAISQSPDAFLTVNDVPIPNGTRSQDFPLILGENLFQIDVHNPTGEVVSYFIVVDRTVFSSAAQGLPAAQDPD